jgi:hypothetical protein
MDPARGWICCIRLLGIRSVGDSSGHGRAEIPLPRFESGLLRKPDMS